MNQKSAQRIMKLLGWKYATPEDGFIPEKKAIFLAAPHTSFTDFLVGYLYACSVGVKFKFMIKKEAFFFPLGAILRALGGFEIDRSNPQKVIMGVMHQMQKNESFYLCICPEGTRKAVRKWKTGYHAIARHCGVPVYLGHFDYRKKTFGHGPKFTIGEDPRKDTDSIQTIYESMHLTARHPSKFRTH